MSAIVATDTILLNQVLEIYNRVKDKRRAEAVQYVMQNKSQARLKELEPLWGEMDAIEKEEQIFCNIDYRKRCRICKFSLRRYNTFNATKRPEGIEIHFIKNMSGENWISDSMKHQNMISLAKYIKSNYKNPIEIQNLFGRYEVDVDGDVCLIKAEIK
jgi:hypothetical protein